MYRLAGAFLALILLRADMYPDASNAKLPAARANILYTPPLCDGFTAADGAITGSTFSSASAVFTAADVGKPISIRKAGVKSFINSAVVSAGGAGHGVGDLVNFADGVQIFVVAVSGGAITKFYLVNRGSATTAAATLAQTSSVLSGTTLAVNAAGGTGAVIAPTWMRENHVTTIAAVVSPTEVTLTVPASASATGAMWGYGTDYSPVIQAALDAGTQVQLPSGICGQASTLTMTDAGTLLGQGRNIDTSGTKLIWLGAPNSPQIFLGTQAGARHSNMQVGRFNLDGLGAASKGYYSRGVTGSTYRNTQFHGHTTAGHDIHGNDAAITSIDNTFEHFTFAYTDPGYDLNASGIWWGFPNTYDLGADNALSQYGLVEIKTLPTATGFLCGASDHNTIVYVQNRGGTAPQTPPGIEMFGSNWASLGHCRANQLLGMDAGQGGLMVRATGWARAPENHINFYDLENGGADYLIEFGGILHVKNNIGRVDGFSLKPRTFATLLTARASSLSYITDSETQIPGQRVLTGGGTYGVPVIYDGTDWRVLAPATSPGASNLDIQNPTGTTNAGAFVMMGLGGTAKATPSQSGTVMLSLSGRMSSSASGGGVRARMKYGTGTAPVNGDAEVGTGACLNSAEQQLNPASSAGQAVPFNLLCVVRNLTPGTQIWFDAAVRAVTSGTASLGGVTAQAMEQ